MQICLTNLIQKGYILSDPYHNSGIYLHASTSHNLSCDGILASQRGSSVCTNPDSSCKTRRGSPHEAPFNIVYIGLRGICVLRSEEHVLVELFLQVVVLGSRLLALILLPKASISVTFLCSILESSGNILVYGHYELTR